MYGLSAGTKKVAVVERWSLAEVRLYYNAWMYQWGQLFKGYRRWEITGSSASNLDKLG